MNGKSITPAGVDFVDLARSDVGSTVLRESVDLVVEEKDLDVQVAPEHMDHMIAADREPVSVPGRHPDIERGV